MNLLANPIDIQPVHEKMFNITIHQGNANQNHDEISHLSEWLLSNGQEVTSVCGPLMGM